MRVEDRDFAKFTDDDLKWFIHHPKTKVSVELATSKTDAFLSYYPTDHLIFEKAVRTTYYKLVEIKENGGSHVHHHNMALTFKRQLIELELRIGKLRQFVSPGIIDLVVNAYQTEISKIRKSFGPIFEILISCETYRYKSLLLKTYWYDFQTIFENSGILWREDYFFNVHYDRVYSHLIDKYVEIIKAEQEVEMALEAKNNE